MEFPERWGVQAKKPSVGGVWIFSGTTQYTTQVWDAVLYECYEWCIFQT